MMMSTEGVRSIRLRTNANFIAVYLLLFLLLIHSFIHISNVSWTTFKELLSAAAAATVLIAVVSVSCIRQCDATFYVAFSVDALLLLGLLSWALVIIFKAIGKKRQQLAHGSRYLVQQEQEELQLDYYSFLKEVAALPKRFRYEELKAATGDFQTPIGRGGSGCVFKGILGNGVPVAVKRIDGEVRGERDFWAEVTAVLSAQHVNLVRILGYCLVPPRGHRFLVYEFYENGSLDSWIFFRQGNGGRRTLSWALRYQIAVDVAKALDYLHHDCRVRVLHLDENFRARVSDFGISRLMGKEESKVLTTVRGTRGYLAPEWFLGVGISEKSDVYSYGMVLLELVGGRRNVIFYDEDGRDDQSGGKAPLPSQGRWSYFPKNASEKMREGKLMEAVDEMLLLTGDMIEEEEVRRMVYVALWCIQDKPELRPSMATVRNMLKGYVKVTMPPETKMFMVDLLQTSEYTDDVDDDSETANQRSSALVSHTTVNVNPGDADADADADDKCTALSAAAISSSSFSPIQNPDQPVVQYFFKLVVFYLLKLSLFCFRFCTPINPSAFVTV